MPALHRSFNPYSSAPPPPASLPDYRIDQSTIEPLTNEQAGSLIDQFLATQDGKVLTLHRLADHLLGRKQVITDPDDVEELGNVLEEERRREGGVVQLQPDEVLYENVGEERVEAETEVPPIRLDRKKARKEERRLKKEREREKRKNEIQEGLQQEPSPKKSKKAKEHKSTEED